MSDREHLARIHRRIGFGLAEGELDALEDEGTSAVIDRLVDPDGAGVPAAPEDLWAGLDLSGREPEVRREHTIEAIGVWLDAMGATQRPLEEWMAWFWHGHLVTETRVVQFVPPMTRQINMFRRLGLGNLRDLLYETTVDPAMLVYLDGATSTGASPNENYGRELLELFALGIGNYTEADVRAAATALTGWRVRRETGEAYFVPRRHDDTPQRLLGASGVHDVDSVVDAVVAHDACAPFIAGTLARAVLGPQVSDELVEDLASDFRSSGLELRPLMRAILEVDEDEWSPMVQGPMPFLVSSEKATGATLGQLRLRMLREADHLPWVPPNVGGWPSGTAWLTSSTTAARYNIAAAIASVAPESGAARQAAAGADYDVLADLLSRPEGFDDTTLDALDQLPGSGDRGVSRLTLALASPDLVLV